MGTSQEPIKLLNTKAQQVYNKLHGIDTPPAQPAQTQTNSTKMMSKSGKPMVRVNGQWEYQ